MKKLISSTVIILVIVGAYFLSPYFIGSAPTQKFTPIVEDKSSEVLNPHVAEGIESFPELNQLREKVAANPQDLGTLMELAEILKQKVIATRDKQLIFELIDTFNNILKVDANNTYALLELANITFESKVFSKAKEFYQRYLNLEPDDLQVRARYASSMIFLRELEPALNELETVLAAKPDDFSALAYKVIALRELGREDEAKVVYDTAVSNAPSEEVKVRLEEYLNQVAKPVSTAGKLDEYLRTNEVTSRKLIGLEVEDTNLKIAFKDFPMEQMPEFAKNKFFAALRGYLKEDQESGLYSEVKTIQIVDADTQNLLAEISRSES